MIWSLIITNGKQGPLPLQTGWALEEKSELLQAFVSWSQRIKKIKLSFQGAKSTSFCILSLVLTVSLKSMCDPSR